MTPRKHAPAATRAFDQALIAWLAAVLDTRGYLSDRPTSAADRRLPTIAVSMRAIGPDVNPVVRQLCRMTAVEPLQLAKKFNRSGCGQHCPEPHVHVTGLYHRWIVGGVKAVVILRATMPYLLVQRDEATRLLRQSGAGNWKPLHVQAMANLGWPVDDVIQRTAAAAGD